MLVLGTTTALQHWSDGKPIETIATHPLPDVADLNAAIPENEWEPGLDGKPRPPWVLQHVVWLIDPRDASIYTFINSTAGAAIATEKLTSRVRSMRLLRGADVCPTIELRSVSMQTKHGKKARPEFAIVPDGWRLLGNGGDATAPLPATQPTAPAQIGKPMKPVSLAEELNDSLPDDDPF
jgi:hypothetical protein